MSSPVPVPVPAPFKIVLDTGIPADNADLAAFGVGSNALGKSAQAFEAALGAVADFFVDAKSKTAKKLNADSMTLSCNLSLTVGATYFVELSATGDFGVSVTYNRPDGGWGPPDAAEGETDSQ